jgi:hypothetical protein
VKRIELPNGGWAEVREQQDLRVMHRRAIQAALGAATVAISKIPASMVDVPDDPEERAAALEKIDMSEIPSLSMDEMLSISRVQEVAVVMFLVAWSLPEPLPTLDTVGDMNIDVFDAIAKVTQKSANALINGIDFAPTPKAEPGNPTGIPGDSNGRSLGRDDNLSGVSSSSDIASISSGN